MSTERSVTTAIIPASGFSTRRLPVSAAFPKEFMPIGNSSSIDYVIDDLVRAHITDIHIVIHPFHRSLFEHYFHAYKELDAHLERKHKPAQLEELHALRRRANFNFIDDPTKSGVDELYGTTIPLRIALETIDNPRAFMYIGADDFTFRTDGGSDLADLVQTFEQSGADAALLGMRASVERLKQGGLLVVKPSQAEQQNEAIWLSGIAEKPTHPEEYPEPRLGNISKYIFTRAIRPFIMENQPNPATNEYYITDVCEAFAAKHKVAVCEAQGTYYDVGTLENWRAANDALGARRG
jgi:UTP--glucose-1-phosphate uridylyltransferase